MKVPISAVLACLLPVSVCLRAQNSPAQQTWTTPAAMAAPPPARQQSDAEGDRFPLLRENADSLKSGYEELHAANTKEIEKLLLTKRCQISRIGGLLDRTVDAMKQWLAAERKYWQSWNDAETKRVEGQTRSLAGMEEDQKRVVDLVDEEKKNREQMERQKAGLEKSKRTEEISAQIDGLIKDIQDSEARLADAQQQFDSLTVSIGNMKASLTARIVSMRQNIASLDAFELDQGAIYESKRATANEVCNKHQPGTGPALPKRVSK